MSFDFAEPYALYTPDCSKILTYFGSSIGLKMVFMYLDAANGELKKAYSKNHCCPYLYSKSAIVMS